MRKLSPLERAISNTYTFVAICVFVLIATAMAMQYADSLWQIGSVVLF